MTAVEQDSLAMHPMYSDIIEELIVYLWSMTAPC